MIKKITSAVFAIFSIASLFAYNPPAGGQNLFRISSPELLSGANSTCGGGFYSVSTDSVVNNPALTAFEQRVILNASGSLFFDGKDESGDTLGGAFEVGALIPSRWYVYSFMVQGVFVPFYDMHLGNTVTFNANVSKDFNDKLSVGLGANIGVSFGNDSDWMGGFNMGAFYNFGDFSFLKDIRFGTALLNLGKSLKNTNLVGITGEKAEYWPSIATFSTGAAAVLLDTKQFDIATSVDFSFPSFMNFVFDAGLQFMIFDIVKLSTSWEFDAKEFSNGHKNIIPSVGLSFKFTFSSKDGSLLANKGWQESEITVGATWRQLYKNINAVSAGAKLNLGLEDTQAPQIILWDQE